MRALRLPLVSLALMAGGWLVLPASAQVSVIQTVRAALVVVTKNSIGTTSTDGARLVNATAAAAGAQQYSPRSCWEGQGWKTDATAASQSVVFCVETQPVQGTSAPSGNWILKASINGGAFANVATVGTDGTFSSGAGVFGTTLVATSSLSPTGTSRSIISSPSDGAVQILNRAQGNTFTVTLDDAKTTLSAESVSVAQDAAVFLGASLLGYLDFTIGTDVRTCAYELRGSDNATAEGRDLSNVCTPTKDNAATVNVYYDAAGASGAGYYLQNKRAGTRAFRITFIGG